MAATYRRLLGVALGAALLLAGCAGAPPPPPPEIVEPLPPVTRSPREVALSSPWASSPASPTVPGEPPRPGWTAPGSSRRSTSGPASTCPAPWPTSTRPVGRWSATNSISATWSFSTATARPGAGVPILAGILSLGGEDEVCHNGIYLGGGRFMHASPRGVFISRLDAEVWRVSYRGARRYLPGGN